MTLVENNNKDILLQTSQWSMHPLKSYEIIVITGALQAKVMNNYVVNQTRLEH